MTLNLSKFGLRPQLPLYFDHQVTGTYGECERMAYYAHILGRRVKRSNSFALDWGSAFHRMTEIWETTSSPEALYEFVQGAIPENEEDHYGRTQSRLLEAFMEWIKFRQLNPIKTLRTEQPTIIRCDQPCLYYPENPSGCGLTYGGIMDRIVEWQGMVGPLDYKTTVRSESDPANEYRLSHQMRGYVWIGSHLMGQHCWGVIIERIVTNKSSIKIGRFPVSYSRDLIREFANQERRRQQRLVAQFESHAFDEDAWLQNNARCWDPYPCQFRDVCLAPASFDFRGKWLRDNTEERRWNFMNRDETEAGQLRLEQIQAIEGTK
jgi:hypothetical protein